MNIICMVTFWLMTATRIHQPLGRMDQTTDKKLPRFVVFWAESYFEDLRTQFGSIGLGSFGSQTHSIASFA